MAMRRVPFIAKALCLACVFTLHTATCSMPIQDLPRARVVFRYPVADGLCNQHYAQILGILLAIHLHADAVVIPPAYARDAFMDDHLKVSWTPSPQNLLWDLRHIEKLLVQYNMTMITAPMMPRNHLVNTPVDPSGAVAEQVILIPELRGNNTDLEEWVQRARTAITAHVQQHLAALQAIQQQQGQVDLYPTLRLPALLGVELRHVPNAVQVGRHVDFAPQLHIIANAIVRRIRREYNTRVFNGAHLRIERDAANWHDFFKPGGIDKVWTYYSEAAQQLGFNVTTPVYVATGVYEMKDVQAMQEVEKWGRGHASNVIHRGMLLRQPHEESKLHSEQLAAIDLLVLAQAHNVVGFSYSSFSWYLAELRAMAGLQRSSMAVVHISGVVLDWREPGATFADV